MTETLKDILRQEAGQLPLQEYSSAFSKMDK